MPVLCAYQSAISLAPTAFACWRLFLLGLGLGRRFFLCGLLGWLASRSLLGRLLLRRSLLFSRLFCGWFARRTRSPAATAATGARCRRGRGGLRTRIDVRHFRLFFLFFFLEILF